MPPLPIRALTLYKQGIGYYQRRGTLTEPFATLVVARESLNDVLKSLDIIVHQGGPLLSVDYETPTDRTEQLAGLSMALGKNTSLQDVIAGLCGTDVVVSTSAGEQITGRVVGLEGNMTDTQPVVLVLQHGAALRILPLATITDIALPDERAAADIQFLLDVRRKEQSRTSLTIRLAPGAHDVELSYSAPSPTWRVSYRIAATGENRARLVGWGLFDNTLDEDLDQVDLTLMSGRPVSFSYDLAETRVPARPQVSDDPTALEQATGDRGIANALSALSHDLRSPLTVIMGYTDLLARDLVGKLTSDQRELIMAIRDRTNVMAKHLTSLLELVSIRDSDNPILPGSLYRGSPLGDLKVSSSYFLPVQAGNAEQHALTYRPTLPISVRRGQAALVPIIDTAVAYQEQCVYNGSKMSNHPLLVWRFSNTSGVALEQGPITVTTAGRYLGEGIVRFTGVGDDVQLPYALEFGLLVAEDHETQAHTLRDVRFDAAERVADVAWYYPSTTRYRVASTVQREIAVLIEHRDPIRGEYVAMPEPAERNGGYTRWSVQVPAHGIAEMMVRERDVYSRQEQVLHWNAAVIDELQSAGGLSAEQYATLQSLVQIQNEQQEAATQTKAYETELTTLLALQAQLRLNLAALGTSDRKASIRNRLLDDLEVSEERRRTIAAAQRLLEQHAQEHQVRQQAVLDALFV